jgi:galactose oxidase-like protein/glyoxal oxidase-like protein
MTSRAPSCLLAVLVFVLFISFLMPTALGQANVTGAWSTAPNPMPINPIHVALLPNGKILVVAGSGNCPPSQAGCPSGPPYNQANGSGALLWDPATENWTQWFPLSWDMFCNGMVLLQDGRAFINGGTIQYGPFYGQLKSSIFDPNTNTFTDVQNMAHGRWYPTVLTLGDGRVMTFSGYNETDATNTAVEFYTIGSGWSTQYIAPWTPDLYPRLHLLPNGKVFYSGAQTTSRFFDPSTHTWTTGPSTNYSGSRNYGTSVLLPLVPDSNGNYDPKVIIMGGHSPATNTTELIDLGAQTPTWQWEGTNPNFTPNMNMSQGRIQMNAVILPNGKILAVGGSVNDEDTSTTSYKADLYDPVSNTSSSASVNRYPRLYHSVALLLPDATVWLAGGNPSHGAYTHQVEIYKPAYLFDSFGNQVTQPTFSGAPRWVSYGKTFTISTTASVSSVVLVRNGTVTHAFGMDQREIQLAYTAGNGSVTATVPSNPNVLPPGYYLLFIVNSSGVPSKASFVQVTPVPPDFSVTASPSSQTVPPGGRTSYTVNVTPSGGYNRSVSFSVSGLPSGSNSSFNPTSVSTSGSSTLTVNTSSLTPMGTYSLTVRATDGTLTHTAQVTLVVPGFSISASPSGQTVSRGSKTTYTVTVARTGSFSSTVNLTVSGLPKRTSASFNPTSVSGSGISTLTITANRPAPVGNYPLTITGTSGSLTHSSTVNLTIR